jgi:hypothetical protein
MDDGKVFDHEDAQLVLDKGTPRFYLMRLPARKPALTFDRITFHAQARGAGQRGAGGACRGSRPSAAPGARAVPRC